METLKLILVQFTNETIIIASTLLITTLIFIIGLWFYNKRKFQMLSHEIPAHVVKQYLDTIINNSTELKQSLFRGNGEGLGAGVPLSGMATGVSSSELAVKDSEIRNLQSLLNDREGTIKGLEDKVADLLQSASTPSSGDNEEVEILQAELEKLRKENESLKANQGSASDNSEEIEGLKTSLAAVTKERDELLEKLREYEIIAEDLADLRILQEKNEALEKELNELKANGATTEVTPEETHEPIEEPVQEVEPEPVVEEPAPVAEEADSDGVGPEDDFEAQMMAAINETAAPPAQEEAPASDSEIDEIIANSGEQKSQEELLKEFEKMIGEE